MATQEQVVDHNVSIESMLSTDGSVLYQVIIRNGGMQGDEWEGLAYRLRIACQNKRHATTLANQLAKSSWFELTCYDD